MAVCTSLCPMVFMTAARFPVWLSVYVPKSCRAQYITKSLGETGLRPGHVCPHGRSKAASVDVSENISEIIPYRAFEVQPLCTDSTFRQYRSVPGGTESISETAFEVRSVGSLTICD